MSETEGETMPRVTSKEKNGELQYQLKVLRRSVKSRKGHNTREIEDGTTQRKLF